jgi:hypothetical protein
VTGVFFLLKLHGGLRWVVALLGVIALARYAWGWARRAEYAGLDRGLLAALSGLLDLSFLLGLILLFGLGGGWPAWRVEHAVTMFLAVAVMHSSAMWRRSDDAPTKFRNNLLAVAATLVLIVVGVLRLRGGWVF